MHKAALAPGEPEDGVGLHKAELLCIAPGHIDMDTVVGEKKEDR
jgi:hypothetical protein